LHNSYSLIMAMGDMPLPIPNLDTKLEFAPSKAGALPICY
jgi:hypothetical protein